MRPYIAILLEFLILNLPLPRTGQYSFRCLELLLKMVLLVILSRYFFCRSDSFLERAFLFVFGYALRILAYGSDFTGIY